jgi:hydroxymethylbilane synthase
VSHTGDRVQDRPLSEIGGKGLFVKRIEEALPRAKPTSPCTPRRFAGELASRLLIGCVPLREDPRDVVVSRLGRPLPSLRQGSASALRRCGAGAVRSPARPDLVMVPLAGNVDTRLRKCRGRRRRDRARACGPGAARPGRLADGAARCRSVLPAVGQGALAIEQREDDALVAACSARVRARGNTASPCRPSGPS